MASECPGFQKFQLLLMFWENPNNLIISTIADPVAEWIEWSQWSPCTVSCGPGTKFRDRTCSEPASAGKDQCPGNATELEDCLLPECPGEP